MPQAAQNFGLQLDQPLTPGFQAAKAAFEAGRFLGFGRRMVAYVIDFLSLMPVTFVTLWVIYGAQTRATGLSWGDVVAECVVLSISVWCWAKWGATPGKALMGVRLVSALDGRPASLRQLVIRYLARLAPLALAAVLIDVLFDLERRSESLEEAVRVINEASLALLTAVGVVAPFWLWALLNPRRQAVHDLVSQTVLVRVAARKSLDSAPSSR